MRKEEKEKNAAHVPDALRVFSKKSKSSSKGGGGGGDGGEDGNEDAVNGDGSDNEDDEANEKISAPSELIRYQITAMLDDTKGKIMVVHDIMRAMVNKEIRWSGGLDRQDDVFLTHPFLEN